MLAYGFGDKKYIIPKKNPLLVADRDIECFKVVRVRRKDRNKRKTRILYKLGLLKHFETYYQEVPITVGKLAKAYPILDIDVLEVKNAISDRLGGGFIHSYQHIEDAKNLLCFKNTVLIKCVIPKGTYYFTGVDDDNADNYASCSIKYVKVIKRTGKVA